MPTFVALTLMLRSLPTEAACLTALALGGERVLYYAAGVPRITEDRRSHGAGGAR